MRQIKSLEEIQHIGFDMLCYLDKIARKNHIKLMLSGGTLLGAARHQGFIPWDDDVDVMLMRRDYERLIRCLEKEKNSPYRIMTLDNTPTYQYPFAKLTDTRTVFVDKSSMEIKGLGAFVDIFPIDAMPRNKKLQKKLIDIVAKQMDCLYSLRDLNYRKITDSKEYNTRLFQVRWRARAATFLAKLPSLRRAEYVAVTIAQYKDKEIIKKEYDTHCTKLMFEGKRFFVPAGYKTYLSNLYGKNYMKLPPKSMQRSWHNLNLYWK